MSQTRIRNYMLLFFVFFVSACSAGGLDGEYVDESGTFKFHFKPDGKVEVSSLLLGISQTREVEYKLEDGKVKVKNATNGPTEVFTIISDDCIECGGLIGTICKNRTAFGGKYSDLIKINAQFLKIQEKCRASLDKSHNAKDVEEALNKLADDTEVLMPILRKMYEKYPELAGKPSHDYPVEAKVMLEESETKLREAGERFRKSVEKIETEPYADDPRIKKAFERWILTLQSGEERSKQK